VSGSNLGMSGSKEDEEPLSREVTRDLALGSSIGGAECVVALDRRTGGRAGAGVECVVTQVGGI